MLEAGSVLSCIDLTMVCPGDIIVHDQCSMWDRDVPCMVICCFKPRNHEFVYQLLVLSMMKSGLPYLHEVKIDVDLASEYRWLVRCKA